MFVSHSLLCIFFYSDSLLSQLVEATSLVQFNVNIQFALPDIRIEPSLEVVQSIVNKLTKEILGVSKTVYWWAADEEKSFHSSIAADKTVVKYCQAIDSSVLG